MKDIRHINEMVKAELESNPNTRNSDISLYIAICQKINPDAMRMEFATAFLRREELGLPKFPTVSRCRRKCQEENPQLRATKEVEDGRYENWKVVREFVQE